MGIYGTCGLLCISQNISISAMVGYITYTEGFFKNSFFGVLFGSSAPVKFDWVLVLMSSSWLVRCGHCIAK